MNNALASKETHVKVLQETHLNLRKKLAANENFEEVWRLHCLEDDVLRQYSVAMHKLATTVWDINCDGTDRTSWCKDFCIEYFLKEGYQKFLEKDQRRKRFYNLDQKNFECNSSQSTSCNETTPTGMPVNFSSEIDANFKIKLLDVGSCYNPFSAYPRFETVAIDLFPANKTVLKCDFLSLDVCNDTSIEECFKSDKPSSEGFCLLKLPSEYFQVVVFSLLLSYIPCSHSRWLMCKKAHEVLCVYGLLLIVTPDSSHQNRHAALMKEWKHSIESIGFHRIKYVKDKHMHFLSFRKVPKNYIWDKRKCNFVSKNRLHIPQDFNDIVASPTGAN